MELIGAKLRDLRLKKKIGMNELARRLGRTSAYVVKVENGKLRPKPTLLTQVFGALDVRMMEPERRQIETLSSLLDEVQLPVDWDERQAAIKKRLELLENFAIGVQRYSGTSIPNVFYSRRFARELDPRGDDSGYGRNQHYRTLGEIKHEVIMNASALTLRLGTPVLMADQLNHLAAIVAEQKHFIGIVSPGFLLADGPTFSLIDSEVVFADLCDGTYITAERQKVARYARVFKDLRDSERLICGRQLYDLLLALASRLAKFYDWPELSAETWPV